MKIWLDDNRIAHKGFHWVYSVNEAKKLIQLCEKTNEPTEILDLDHDLGEYAKDGGDGIKLVDWLAETKRFYPIKLHTMNPIGRENMQREINRYWKL